MDDIKIRVRANCSVLGMFPGEVHEVPPTRRIEVLLKAGKLTWVDEPKDDGYGI